MKVLNKRLSQYEAQIRSLSALQARDRLLATIRLLNQKEDESILPPILRMPTRITHEKLGHMTGLTRETVTKELKNLQAEGFINVDKKHIRLSQNGIREVMAIS
jgi:CRP/FNR family transcriptional regulator